MKQKELGIYVHIPFCVKKCYYCDFISFANRDEAIKDYINALKKEIIDTHNADVVGAAWHAAQNKEQR